MRPDVQQAGCLTVEQLKQVALWKAPRAARHIDRNYPAYVREVTGWALNAESERARIETLTIIDGVRWPTASVILHLFHRDPYPILDFRALWSVGLEVPDRYTFSFWWAYVEFCRDVAQRNSVDMRTLDRALWQYSKKNQRADGMAKARGAGPTCEDDPVQLEAVSTGTLADRIRAFTYEQVIRPAFGKGQDEVTVRAGDIHKAMGLVSQMPSVCAALESRIFGKRYGLALVHREGPARGANVFFRFKRTSEAAGGVELPPKARQRPAPALLPRKPVATQEPPLAGATYLVACVSQKRSQPAPAKDLYVSDWFTKARRYVEAQGAPWQILSAQYGLVSPDEVVDPYERTLNTLGVAERRRWADLVLRQFDEKMRGTKRVVLFAGMRYREFIEPRLRERGIEVQVPMAGLRIGEQLGWLAARA